MAARSKKWYESRTIWMAVVQAILGIIIAVGTEFDLPGGVLVLKSILDTILRLDTHKALK